MDQTLIRRNPRHEQDRALARIAENSQAMAALPMTVADIESTIPARFAEVVAHHGERLAVRSPQHTWSYRELDVHSNRVAHALLARLGPGSEPLALLCSHDAPSIAAVYGILKAGKFHAPLDVTYPPARLQMLLEDLEARLVVVDSPMLPFALSLGLTQDQLLVVDAHLTGDDLGTPVVDLTPDHYAYVIYTSGTTGQPKGVIENHRNVLNFTYISAQSYKYSLNDRALHCIPHSFSASATTIYPNLLVGTSIHIFPPDLDRLAELRRWIQQEEITTYITAPSFFRTLMEGVEEEIPFPTIHLLRLGGDRMLPGDVALFRRHFLPNTVMRLGYGASEIKYITAVYLCQDDPLDGNSLPAGLPEYDIEVAIWDDDGQPCGAGETGEVIIFSPHLSPGYWRRPEINALRFGIDAQGRRYYRSGDLGRLDAGGQLWIVGRRNGQLKIQGQRVETAEVEQVLLSIPGVREVAVVAHEDENQQPHLVAYLSTAPDALLPDAELRAAARQHLPALMVPSLFYRLASLPRNSNGKVDVQQLPDWTAVLTAQAGGELPSSMTERQLAKLIGELVGIKRVGRESDFFALGGSSLLAARLLVRIKRHFGVELPPRAFFETPTVAGLAAAIDTLAQIGAATGKAIATGNSCPSAMVRVAAGDGTLLPLFFCLGGGGSGTELMWYSPLLRDLPPAQPIFALLARGVENSSQPPATIAEMEEDALAALRAIQPHGPYLLGGECIGAKLAFRLAQQLEAAGEVVTLLLLLDPYALNAQEQTRSAQRARQWQHLRQWQRRGLYHWDYLRRLDWREGQHYIWQRLLAWANVPMLEGFAQDRPLQQLLAARRNYRRLLLQLPLQDRVRASTVIIASQESARDGVVAAWQPYLQGEVVVQRVSGNHRNYLGKYRHETSRYLVSSLQLAQERALRVMATASDTRVDRGELRRSSLTPLVPQPVLAKAATPLVTNLTNTGD